MVERLLLAWRRRSQQGPASATQDRARSKTGLATSIDEWCACCRLEHASQPAPAGKRIDKALEYAFNVHFVRLGWHCLLQ